MFGASVSGGDGVGIGLRVAGEPGAPAIVFVHGWAQAAHVWRHQFADHQLAAGRKLVAMDLRGHGRSDAPESGYDDPNVWAEDLAAVLQRAGAPVIVVGWSYGGLVIADYLRRYGDQGLAGLVFVGAITEIGKNRPGGTIGPAMSGALPDALSEDTASAGTAVARLCSDMTVEPLSGDRVQELMGTTLTVRPAVRAALFRRDVDNADVLSSVSIPTLVLHGAQDTVVDPTSGEYTAGKISGAELRCMPDVGHLPFIERTDEFNSVLRQFAEQHLPISRTG